jgi:tRNA A37 threonylcarbamoyladenosine dehydratase
MAYWLDLYYQVRKAYEIETGGEPDPTLIRKADLRTMLQDTVRDALRGTLKQEAARRMEKKQEEDPIKRRATPFKRQVADRLAEARKNGATIASISKASGGTVAEGQILSILEGHALATEVYTALDAALAQVEAQQA